MELKGSQIKSIRYNAQKPDTFKLDKVVHLGNPVPDTILEYLSDDKNNQMFVFTRTDEEDAIMEEHAEKWKGKKLSWFKWRTNEGLEALFFEKIDLFIGAKIVGEKGATDTTVIDEFAGILCGVVNLVNFDNGSGEVLRTDRSPLKNLIGNAPQFLSPSNISLEEVKGLCKGKIGILVGAGPSLNKEMKNLRKLHRLPNVVMICVARSLRLLQKHYIFPEYTVSCEQYDWDSVILDGLYNMSATTLCYNGVCTPSIPSKWKGKKMFIVDHHFREIMGWKYSLDGGNSVAHHCLNILGWLGCKEVVMVGMDLGYPEGIEKTHAQGTFHDWPEEILGKEHAPQQENWVFALDGSRLRSSFAYQDFATLFRILITKRGIRAYNANPRAHRISNVGVVNLTKLVKTGNLEEAILHPIGNLPDPEPLSEAEPLPPKTTLSPSVDALGLPLPLERQIQRPTSNADDEVLHTDLQQVTLPPIPTEKETQGPTPK